MIEKALNKDIDLWALDECHFYQHGSRCKMWVPPENMDPIVYHAPTRKSISVFGAVQIATGKLITMITSKFNAEIFQIFLDQFISPEYDNFSLNIILDNSRYHHATALAPWLERT